MLISHSSAVVFLDDTSIPISSVSDGGMPGEGGGRRSITSATPITPTISGSECGRSFVISSLRDSISLSNNVRVLQ